MVLAQIVSGTSFAIFFGGGRNDAIVAVFASAAMALTGYWIGKREKNPMIYNLVLAFVTEMVILFSRKNGSCNSFGSYHDRDCHGDDQHPWRDQWTA